jgi:hypothetical protein
MGTQFRLRIPLSWWEFDVWRATRTADLARHVDARVAEQPMLRKHRGPLLRALREAAADTERQGALMCVVMGELVDGAALAAVLVAVQTHGSAERSDNTPRLSPGRSRRRPTGKDHRIGGRSRFWSYRPADPYDFAASSP